MENFWKRAFLEVALAASVAAVAALFAVSLFAVFVRAYAPADVTVFLINQLIKCCAVFLFSLIFIHRERALFKGMAAGLLFLFVTTLIFGIIGGFHLNVFFLAEMLLCALFGSLGALCGVKLRKE